MYALLRELHFGEVSCLLDDANAFRSVQLRWQSYGQNLSSDIYWNSILQGEDPLIDKYSGFLASKRLFTHQLKDSNFQPVTGQTLELGLSSLISRRISRAGNSSIIVIVANKKKLWILVGHLDQTLRKYATTLRGSGSLISQALKATRESEYLG